MDPLSQLLAEKKKESPAVLEEAPPPNRNLNVESCSRSTSEFFDVESTLGKQSRSQARWVATAEKLIEKALRPESTVNFPMVTEICERVAARPAEAPKAVEALIRALEPEDPPVLPHRLLKALTILHELIYDSEAAKAVVASPQALSRLRNVQQTRDTGLGDAPDAQIRMFATEVEKCCFTNWNGSPAARKRDKALLLAQELGLVAREEEEASQESLKKRELARELLWDLGSSLHANLAVVSARAQSAAQQTLSEAQAAAEWAVEALQDSGAPISPGKNQPSPPGSSQSRTSSKPQAVAHAFGAHREQAAERPLVDTTGRAALVVPQQLANGHKEEQQVDVSPRESSRQSPKGGMPAVVCPGDAPTVDEWE